MNTEGIIQSLNSSDEWRDFFNSHRNDRNYLAGTDLCVSSYNFTKLIIGDLSNAFKRGKVCAFYTLSGTTFDDLFKIIEKYDFDPKMILDACSKLEFEGDFSEISFESITVYKNDQKGVNTYSPFHLNRLKPLKEIPRKWTLNHAIRLLANGQFENLHTTGRYTSDYAFDSAYDFQRGEYDSKTLIHDLVESPRGWWVSEAKKDGDVLGINCHSFDYKDLIVRLSGRDTTESDDVLIISDAMETVKSANVVPAGILMN